MVDEIEVRYSVSIRSIFTLRLRRYRGSRGIPQEYETILYSTDCFIKNICVIPRLRAKRSLCHPTAVLIRDFSSLTQSHLFFFTAILLLILHNSLPASIILCYILARGWQRGELEEKRRVTLSTHTTARYLCCS